MLTKEQNDVLTQTGPGTPAGELLRHYWQPVALSAEMPPGSSPTPVRVLGEDLVLFRDDQGRPGLLGLHCSHRAADLSYGRLEDGGLRCLYHGWLYDIHGTCLEQPGEPEDLDFKSKIKHPAYPCQEAGDIIFAYMGRADPPMLPLYAPLAVPSEYRIITKVSLACNYLQGNEGNFDPTHLSFLHRYLNSDKGRPSQPKVRGSELKKAEFEDLNRAPTIEFEETDFGLRIFTMRPGGQGKTYVSISNFVHPNLAVAGGGLGGFRIVWHVPIDDIHHWRWDIMFQLADPISEHERQFYASETLPDGRLKRNPSNRYGFDPTTGTMGANFIAHDAYATEGEGLIYDRTRERLGQTDKALTAVRHLLLRAIRAVQEGDEPPHIIRDSSANRLSHIVSTAEVVPAEQWRTAWKARAAEVEELMPS